MKHVSFCVIGTCLTFYALCHQLQTVFYLWGWAKVYVNCREWFSLCFHMGWEERRQHGQNYPVVDRNNVRVASEMRNWKSFFFFWSKWHEFNEHLYIVFEKQKYLEYNFTCFLIVFNWTFLSFALSNVNIIYEKNEDRVWEGIHCMKQFNIPRSNRMSWSFNTCESGFLAWTFLQCFNELLVNSSRLISLFVLCSSNKSLKFAFWRAFLPCSQITSEGAAETEQIDTLWTAIE